MSNPFDQLRNSLEECLDIAPGKVMQVIAKTCESYGVRIVLAAVGKPIGPHPQVEISVTMDDVTSRVISQVVDPVLRKAGVPDNMVLMLAAAAGEAAMRSIKKYQEGVAKREAMKERIRRAAGEHPVVDAETTDSKGTAGNWRNQG